MLAGQIHLVLAHAVMIDGAPVRRDIFQTLVINWDLGVHVGRCQLRLGAVPVNASSCLYYCFFILWLLLQQSLIDVWSLLRLHVWRLRWLHPASHLHIGHFLGRVARLQGSVFYGKNFYAVMTVVCTIWCLILTLPTRIELRVGKLIIFARTLTHLFVAVLHLVRGFSQFSWVLRCSGIISRICNIILMCCKFVILFVHRWPL
jgi:hypothetical protein